MTPDDALQLLTAFCSTLTDDQRRDRRVSAPSQPLRKSPW